MKKGTTPVHRFTLPFDTDSMSITAIEITYCQNGIVVLQKREDDCEMSDRVISVRLSQEDTFKFQNGVNVEIQVRLKDDKGTVLASGIKGVTCQRCLSNEVL